MKEIKVGEEFYDVRFIKGNYYNSYGVVKDKLLRVEALCNERVYYKFQSGLEVTVNKDEALIASFPMAKLYKSEAANKCVEMNKEYLKDMINNLMDKI